jgi:hypothetical protein
VVEARRGEGSVAAFDVQFARVCAAFEHPTPVSALQRAPAPVNAEERVDPLPVEEVTVLPPLGPPVLSFADSVCDATTFM